VDEEALAHEGLVMPKTNKTSKITIMSFEAFSKNSLSTATSSCSRTTLDLFMNPYDMSEVLRARDVTPCGLVGRYRRLGGMFALVYRYETLLAVCFVMCGCFFADRRRPLCRYSSLAD
jgi:hypothetical protein